MKFEWTKQEKCVWAGRCLDPNCEKKERCIVLKHQAESEKKETTTDGGA